MVSAVDDTLSFRSHSEMISCAFLAGVVPIGLPSQISPRTLPRRSYRDLLESRAMLSKMWETFRCASSESWHVLKREATRVGERGAGRQNARPGSSRIPGTRKTNTSEDSSASRRLSPGQGWRESVLSPTKIVFGFGHRGKEFSSHRKDPAIPAIFTGLSPSWTPRLSAFRPRNRPPPGEPRGGGGDRRRTNQRHSCLRTQLIPIFTIAIMVGPLS